MGGVLLVISLFMFTFPKNPPNYRLEDEQTSVDDFFSTLKKIVCPCGENALKIIPIILVMCHAFSSVPISALTTYGGKFLERQYGLSAHSAGAYFGMVTIISSMVGTYLGGWFHRRQNFR